jgi:Tfp pilus assembly protein PilX
MRNPSARLAALRREDGVTMVLMVMIVALIGVLSLAMLESIQGESRRSNTAVKRDAAFAAAEAGINSYRSKLVDDTAFHSHYLAKGESTRGTSGGTVVAGSGETNVAWTHGTSWTYPNGFDTWYPLGNGFEYSLQVTPPSAGSSATKIVAVGRPTGSATDMRKLETLVRPAGVTDFQMLANWDITYGSAATTKGKIYAGKDANGIKHNVTHNGVAHADIYAEGDVTGTVSLQSGAKRYDKDTNPTIRTVIANPINFASFMSSLVDIQAASQSAGVYLNNTSVSAWWLKFSNDGTFTAQGCAPGPPWWNSSTNSWVASTIEGKNAPVCSGPVTTYPVPANGAIFVAQTAIVSNAPSAGGVKGRVTVASNNDIVIGGDVNPVTSGTDVLGLVAANEMIVAYWVPYNLTWTAATMSQAGEWKSFNNECQGVPPASCAHGTMTFTGSTATYGGGSMSMFSSRLYQYDPTLLYLQPPWFPTLGDSLTTLLFRELPA